MAPRSELFVHENWFPQSAMDVLLETDGRVADKDRLHDRGIVSAEHLELLRQPRAHYLVGTPNPWEIITKPPAGSRRLLQGRAANPVDLH